MHQTRDKMNPRQMKEYKHSQKVKAEEMRQKKKQEELKAEKKAITEKWLKSRGNLVEALRETIREQELERAEQEYGLKAMEHGNLKIWTMDETIDDEGKIKVKIFAKFYPKGVEKPEYGTTGEGVIDARALAKSWAKSVANGGKL